MRPPISGVPRLPVSGKGGQVTRTAAMDVYARCPASYLISKPGSRAADRCGGRGRRRAHALEAGIQRFPGQAGGAGASLLAAPGHNDRVASYSVNPDAVAYAQQLIDSRQYVLDSDWGKVQPSADEQNAYLESHTWEEYARWHLGLTGGARDQTKARYAFVYGDFRRLHRMGIIACHYRAAEWRHKDIELAAHELLQRLDRMKS
jgi:hypothetical protein